MSDFDRHSRVNKFEKRRKNTKSISMLLVIGGILIIILLGMWIFGGNDKKSDDSKTTTEEQNDDGQADANDTEENMNKSETNEDAVDNDEDAAETNNEDDTSENQDTEADGNDAIPSDDVDTEEINNPDDDNVVKAYTGNWQPVGTSQSEPHEVQYDTESQDWKEMEKAIKYATGLSDMTTYWIGNGGDQKVVGTVSDPDKTTIYRVSLTWQTNEGWQPTKVEILKEVD